MNGGQLDQPPHLGDRPEPSSEVDHQTPPGESRDVEHLGGGDAPADPFDDRRRIDLRRQQLAHGLYRPAQPRRTGGQRSHPVVVNAQPVSLGAELGPARVDGQYDLVATCPTCHDRLSLADRQRQTGCRAEQFAQHRRRSDRVAGGHDGGVGSDHEAARSRIGLARGRNDQRQHASRCCQHRASLRAFAGAAIRPDQWKTAPDGGNPVWRRTACAWLDVAAPERQRLHQARAPQRAAPTSALTYGGEHHDAGPPGSPDPSHRQADGE